ncbi:hypothetical protein EYF80_000055 [Liparis tanakae]|uniref:Uncharacterized protein n=1 Tax=Liparis tanakae TaxID=230148 RepID=A0A4Z2JJP0_9TELE|nr:hypothetical protein EYF80_000055 [Liparis tanakae]
MEAPRRRIPLSVALCVRALVCVVVRVAGRPGVGEPGMRSGAGRYGPSAGLALESRGSQAAGTGSVGEPLGAEVAPGLLHDLRPLTSQHAGWSLVSDEVVDAEHAVLSRSEPGWRGRRAGLTVMLLYTELVYAADLAIWTGENTGVSWTYEVGLFLLRPRGCSSDCSGRLEAEKVLSAGESFSTLTTGIVMDSSEMSLQRRNETLQ